MRSTFMREIPESCYTIFDLTERTAVRVSPRCRIRGTRRRIEKEKKTEFTPAASAATRGSVATAQLAN